MDCETGLVNRLAVLVRGMCMYLIHRWGGPACCSLWTIVGRRSFLDESRSVLHCDLHFYLRSIASVRVRKRGRRGDREHTELQHRTKYLSHPLIPYAHTHSHSSHCYHSHPPPQNSARTSPIPTIPPLSSLSASPEGLQWDVVHRWCSSSP